ncbi:MAG: GHKL domain-containing protein [Marinobacter adhaerens]|uniref:histidine kinase n=1 Tax=Marinobacter adhaerens TaxID=1033846 RepID=A0A844HX51_9GAMM|nr:GHKL domain-containing protein [Marinobacter sp.]MCD1649610.1 GHKL domain-containing protein [Marinobacter adhaerens]MTI99609.1 GHKL domain-containing protein [Marinobacter adhaerens]QTN43730.1 GHKL domain-containing protein [Marinobacter salsuginis]QWV14990.1 GHKL domain-containing protein [Marinobacter adhaerens]
MSQYSVHIEDSQGRSFTSENIEPKLQVVESFRNPGIFHISYNDRSILGYYKIFNNRQDKLSVTIIEKSSYSPNTLDKIHGLIWIISFTILVTISMIIFIGVTIALKPLKMMSSQLTSLKNGERNRLDENVPEEFTELVKHLNRLLESYDKKLSRSRHLAADISHSLKTPLAVINSMINDEAIPTTIASQIKSQLSEMHELIDTQMRKTEMSGQYIGKATPIIERTLALVDVVSRIYPYKQIHLQETLPRELVWPIDERDFNEILGNVLDNASKWCSQEVHLHLKLHDDTLTILVEDDGPGVASHQLADLTRRQKRLDEKTPGYGLGLSIVEEITNDYGGAMHFSISPKGGLRVLIELPRSI